MTTHAFRSPGTKPLFVSLAAYVVLLVVTGGVLAQLDDPPVAVAAALSLLPPLAAAVGLFLQRRSIRAQDGIERAVYSESAAVAFIITMLSALSWGFLQDGADAPELDGFVVWGFGMGVWAIVSVVMSLRSR